ncbi:hypothetical protein N2152v2_009128 [Parachlorella kessleri]
MDEFETARDPLLSEEHKFVSHSPQSHPGRCHIQRASSEGHFSRLLSWRPLLGYSGAFVLAFLAIAGVTVLILERFAADAYPPACRKSSAVAVLPGRSSNTSFELLVWSGMGRHKSPLSDLHSFDAGTGQWHAERASSRGRGGFWRRITWRHPGRGPLPRWKAGTAQVLDNKGGLVVFGGDAFPAHGRHIYESDLWLLEFSSLKWRQANVTAADHARLPDDVGAQKMVVFGGRGAHGLLLNDVWEATLSFPNVTWRLLAPGTKKHHAAEDGGGGKEGVVPAPRKGHSAVLVGEPGSPHMLVFGGRDTQDYFGDLWLFDIKAGTWEQVEPSSRIAPAARDHHAAAFYHGKMFVHGGRSGVSYETSRPLDGLWAFDLQARAWQQVPQPGATPLPRFLHSYVQYAPAGSPDASRLVVFGGETLDNCRLNDVWELSLGSMLWSQLSPPHFCGHKCKMAFRGTEV